MYLASMISFLCVLAYLFFGLRILRLDARSRRSRIFFTLCLNYALAAFFSMLQYSARSLETCLAWNNFYLPFSLLSVGLIMHFHLELCLSGRVRAWMLVLSYIPSAFFILNVVSGHYYISDFRLGPYGWHPDRMSTPATELFNVTVFLIFEIIEILLLIRYGRRSSFRRVKRQTRILIVSIVASFIVSGLYQGLIFGRAVPMPLLPFATQLIWMAGIWYALERYNFMGLSMSLASSQIVAHVNEMLILCDSRAHIMETNERFLAITGIAAPEDKSGARSRLADILHEEGLAELVETLLTGSRDHGTMEAALLTGAGVDVPVRIHASSLRDSAGEVEGIIIVAEDLRAIKELERLNDRNAVLLEEKRILLAEVHHRIKNNMGTIRALLNLQLDATSDPVARAAIADAESRVISMAVLYDKLYRSTVHSSLVCDTYLSPLIDEVMANFPEASRVLVTKSIGNFELPSDSLLPLGIIVNELLTNAMKYAFAGRESGCLTITADSLDGLIRVSVSDDGAGMPESFDIETSSGFGLTMIRGLADQIGGTLRIERGEGARFVLEFKA